MRKYRNVKKIGKYRKYRKNIGRHNSCNMVGACILHKNTTITDRRESWSSRSAGSADVDADRELAPGAKSASLDSTSMSFSAATWRIRSSTWSAGVDRVMAAPIEASRV